MEGLMSWVMKCDHCSAIGHSIFPMRPWIIAEDDGATLSLKLLESNQNAFARPNLPELKDFRSSLSFGSFAMPSINDPSKVRHFCSEEHLLAYLRERLNVEREKADAVTS
jgi:hypothetical protein